MNDPDFLQEALTDRGGTLSWGPVQEDERCGKGAFGGRRLIRR
jgi:hypothetical protein